MTFLKGVLYQSKIEHISVFFSGTRFRPLSLETPKPLFPVAGFPIIHHHVEACAQVNYF